MTAGDRPPVGAITWMDLTVMEAESVRDFYSAVVGWKTEAHPMGEYSDYVMQEPDSGRTVTGICHARGVNATMPSQWLLYISVADLDASVSRAIELGGKVIGPERDMGAYGRMVVIQDPAGAVAALVQPPRV